MNQVEAKKLKYGDDYFHKLSKYIWSIRRLRYGQSGLKDPSKPRKTSETTRKRHGKNFYVELARKGGSVKCKKGFATNPELASRVGRLGGQRSIPYSKNPRT